MQLCAHDLEHQLVFAENAAKQCDYFCLECQQTVRLRSGMHRQAHFYHLRPNSQCRLHAKGMPHLMLQYFLKQTLPKGEAEVECRFPSINRIADVVWHTERLVYEIQCSPISPDEVLARNADYASVGYRVVWIFHQDRYNHSRVTAAESVVWNSPHYFTDMNAHGQGRVYDQFALIERGIRVHCLSPLPVDLTSPHFKDKNQRGHYGRLPQDLRKRAEAWAVRFSGDTVDSCLKGDNEQLLCQIENLPGGGNPLLWSYFVSRSQSIFQKWIASPYRTLFRHFLEKACR